MKTTEVTESCREWVEEKFNRCGEPAVLLLWGKLFPLAALGPRCRAHAEKHLNGRTMESVIREHWAVLDLRGLRRTK